MSNQKLAEPKANEAEKAQATTKGTRYVVLKAITYGPAAGRKVIAPAKPKKSPVIVELDPQSSEAKRFLERECIISVADYEKANRIADDDSENGDQGKGDKK